MAALLANTWVGSADAGGSEADAHAGAGSLGADSPEFDVTLLTLDAKPPFYDIDPRVTLIQAPKWIDRLGGWRKAVGLWFWLPRQAKAIDPDVILSFGEGYNAFVMARLGFLNRPIFLGNRTTPVTSLRGVRGFINPMFYKKAAGVFVQTQRSIELLSEHYRGTSFSVIPNPIHEVTIAPDLGQKTILNVGSLGGKKNQGELIEIFAGLRADFPDWTLVFAGDGPHRAMLEEKVRVLGLQDRVEFRGVVRDLASLYREASIFAFTSLLEGFPNALGEAMRVGLPVIAYDCITGPSELISHGEDGFLIALEDSTRDVDTTVLGVRDMDAQDLDAREGSSRISDASDKEALDIRYKKSTNEYKKHLSKLMASKELREHLGRRARQNTEKLSPQRIANLYLAHFRKALSHQPA